jgi:AcrR family transcriptional regulator
MSQGLRERKKAETRAALADAALQLADEHGPDKVTVEAITEVAGVSPRTFFNYFSTKEEAILGVQRVDESPLRDALVSRPADEAPLEALRAAFVASVERLQDDPDRWVRRRRLVQQHPHLAVRWAAHTAELEHDMVVEVASRLGLDPERSTYPGVVVGAAMAAIRVAMTVWQVRSDRTLDDLFDEVFDQLAGGLTAPPP